MMAPLFRRCVLALCLFAVFDPAHYLARAEEQPPAEGEEKAEAEKAEPAAAEGELGPAEGEEASGDAANFVDSAKDLQDKLGQLQALLDAKSEGADPALQERLAGLKEQLTKLNLGGLMGGGAGDEALSELVGGCTALAVRRAGMQRASTISQLRKISSGTLSLEQAAELDLMRMISVCIFEMSTEELHLFKAGKLTSLPAEMVEKATAEEAKKTVLELEPNMWSELKTVSKALLEQIGTGSEQESGLPNKIGLLAAIPLLWVFAFFGKKFMDMQKREEGRKDKKDRKKSK